MSSILLYSPFMETLIRNVGSGVSKTRNSALRQQTDVLIHATTLVIHRALPWLTPNEITALGVIEVLGGVYLAERNNLAIIPSGLVNTTSLFLEGDGYLKDRFDGELARIVNNEFPGKHDSSIGQLCDVMADRTEEIGAAIFRAHTAYIKKSKLGEQAAFSVAVTTTLPSLTRAYVESLGYAVPEMGLNIFQAAGTRFGRIILGTAATHFREIRGVPLQPAIDTFSAVANVNNAITRLCILKDRRTRPSLGEKERSEALSRGKILAATEAVSIIAALAAHEIFRLTDPRLDSPPLFITSDILDKNMSPFHLK